MPFFKGNKWKCRWGRSSRQAQFVENANVPDLFVNLVDQHFYPRMPVYRGANEVWPRLYIGDMYTAENIAEMRKYQFTHVVNCAHYTGRDHTIYDDLGITYMGIEAIDQPSYDMSAHFKPVAEFIHSGLMQGGKVLVHCYAGLSRSATLVLAYLMLKHNKTLMTAIRTVKVERGIHPNAGFLKQLINLHIRLHETGRTWISRPLAILL